MNTNILYIFTRTPLHVGCGSSVGVVDQPVQRERHTGHPIIPGSSIKGVLRDQVRTHQQQDENTLFGYAADSREGESAAGIISFSEARPVLFPLRSAKGSFAFITCPLVLQRYARDKGLDLSIPSQPADQTCLAASTVTLGQGDRKGVVLEEYRFDAAGEFPGEWASHLSEILDDAVLGAASDRLVLLSDGDFSHFAMNACMVNQHVRISPETGTVDGSLLFNEETVPSETLFYSVATALPRQSQEHSKLIESYRETMSGENLIQFGGNGTTGLGFCTIKLL